MSTTDALARAQNAFEDQVKQTERRHHGIERQAKWRRAFAYIAKIIVAMAGLLMTLDAVKPYNVPVGLLIATLVTLDYVFSNQPKLLVLTQAEQAYRRLREDIRHRHDVKMPTLLRDRDQNPPEFAGALIAFLQQLLDEMHTRKTAIEDAINAADVKALTRLAIDTA